MEEYNAVDPVFDESIYEAIDLQTCVNQRDIVGGPAESTVRRAIAVNRSLFQKA